MLWDKWTEVHAISQQFFPFCIRSGKYIIATTTLRVKQFSSSLCISSVFSPPAFSGTDAHSLWHSSPGGKAEGNACTLHEVKPLPSQESIHRNETPSLLSGGFIRATVGCPTLRVWQRLTRGIPAPLQPTLSATCQQTSMQSFPEKSTTKGWVLQAREHLWRISEQM